MPKQRGSPEEAAILGALRAAKHPLSLRELARELNLHGRERHELKKAVQQLLHQSQGAEVHGGRFKPADSKPAQEVKRPAPQKTAPPRHGKNDVRGRLVAHRDGYGFVIPDQPVPGMEGDVFIPPNALGDAMHGDRVWVRLREGRGGRRGGGRVEGQVVGVERRAHPTLVGRFRRGPEYNYVEPYEERIRYQVLIPPGAEKGKGGGSAAELDGAVVNVEITHFPGASGAMPKGHVLEVLGKPGDFGIDVEIVIRKYHLPDAFPEEVLREARGVPQQVDPKELLYRQDFRHLPIVTIDGEDAKDFDDAVFVDRRPDGNFLLHVHIADVSHYVRPGSELDHEARLRGTSVYFPNRAVPMLPVELSNGICSLNPQVDRLALSCLMEIDPKGDVIRCGFAESVFHSVERMTYTGVNAVLEGDLVARQRYAALVPEFEKMRELALILNAKRERRGSIDFDLPEPIIRFDDRGQMIGITRSERNIAHRLIEEFMLAANETVASFLEEQAVASLFRVHEVPDPQKVMEFEEIAATFGYSLGISEQFIKHVRIKDRHAAARGQRPRGHAVPERITLSPRLYQKLTDKIAGRPEERILSYLMLRSLKQARYSEKNVGHFALAAPTYTHFTSPIRRYPDLIVHRLLKWTLLDLRAREVTSPVAQDRAFLGRPAAAGAHVRGDGKTLRGPLAVVELAAVATESSEAERRAADAERELVELKKLDYMEQHLGDEFDGLVISMTKFGFYVELMEMFVEGIVPLETLDRDADYYYREPTRSIAPGRRSRVPNAPAFRMGDRVRVRVDRIDRTRRKLQFSVVGPAAGAGKA